MIEKISALKSFANSKQMQHFDYLCSFAIFAYALWLYYCNDSRGGNLNLAISALVLFLAYARPAIYMEKKLKEIISKRNIS
ncbi:hypothetical protein D3C85_1543010 [compost metagenome]